MSNSIDGILVSQINSNSACMNSAVGLSQFTTRKCFKHASELGRVSCSLMKLLIALKMICAHRDNGNLLTPDEIAGIAIEVHFKVLAS